MDGMKPDVAHTDQTSLTEDIAEEAEPATILGMRVKRVLPLELVLILSAPDRPFDAIYKDIESTRRKTRLKKPRWPTDDFLLAMEVKKQLDELVRLHWEDYAEEEVSDLDTIHPESLWVLGPVLQSYVAMVYNCEWLIWKLSGEVEMRWNPFLVHWVEASRTWSQKLADNEKKCASETSTKRLWRRIHVAHLRLLEVIMEGEDEKASAMRNHGAYTLYLFLSMRDPEGVSLDPYLRMLVEEGIYTQEEAYGTTSKAPPNDTIHPTNCIATHSIQPPKATYTTTLALPRSHLTQETVLELLLQDPVSARRALTHLPIDIPHLDTLNTALGSDILPALGMQRADVVRDYLQHALLTLERAHASVIDMPSPSPSPSPSLRPEHDSMMSAARGPSTRAAGPSPTNGNVSPESASDGDVPPLDKEAEKRAVRLPMLFIKSAFKKGFATPDDLTFEIQEICVRYIWMREVREFRGVLGFGGPVG